MRIVGIEEIIAFVGGQVLELLSVPRGCSVALVLALHAHYPSADMTVCLHEEFDQGKISPFGTMGIMNVVETLSDQPSHFNVIPDPVRFQFV